MKNDVPLSINSNVTIKCIDRHGRVTRTSHVHNKATYHLVEGILKFLRGDFTSSNYGDDYDPELAYQYLPSEMRFGTVGVKMDDRSTEFPLLKGLDYSEMKVPTFDEYRLQQELKVDRVNFDMPKIKFESVSLASYDDPNNSMGLILHAYIPPGALVGFNNDPGEDLVSENSIVRRGSRVYYTDSLVGDGNGWTFWRRKVPGETNYDLNGEGEYEAIFTELGLYSGSGDLLARVLFDGGMGLEYDEKGKSYGKITFEDDTNENNPIIQTDSSSIVIEWKIGVVSIGQNDAILSAADLRSLGVTIETDMEGYVVEKQRLVEELQALLDKMYREDLKEDPPSYQSMINERSRLVESLNQVNNTLFYIGDVSEDYLVEEKQRLVDDLRKVNQQLFRINENYLTEERDRLLQALEDLEDDLVEAKNPDAIRREIESLESQISQVESEQETLRLSYQVSEIERLRAELESVNRQLNSLNDTDSDEFERARQEKERLESQIQEAEVALEEMTEAYSELDLDKSGLVVRLNYLTEILSHLD